MLNPPDAESGKEWQTWKRGFGNPFFISCKKCRDHQKYWHNFTQLIVYGQSPSTPAACVHRDTLPALGSDMTSFRHSCGPHMRRGKGTIDQGGRRKSRLTWLLSWPSNWEGRPKAEPWMWGGVMVVESASVTLPFSWMQCLRSPCPLLFSCLPACLSQSRFVHENDLQSLWLYQLPDIDVPDRPNPLKKGFIPLTEKPWRTAHSFISAPQYVLNMCCVLSCATLICPNRLAFVALSGKGYCLNVSAIYIALISHNY